MKRVWKFTFVILLLTSLVRGESGDYPKYFDFKAVEEEGTIKLTEITPIPRPQLKAGRCYLKLRAAGELVGAIIHKESDRVTNADIGTDDLVSFDELGLKGDKEVRLGDLMLSPGRDTNRLSPAPPPPPKPRRIAAMGAVSADEGVLFFRMGGKDYRLEATPDITRGLLNSRANSVKAISGRFESPQSDVLIIESYIDSDYKKDFEMRKFLTAVERGDDETIRELAKAPSEEEVLAKMKEDSHRSYLAHQDRLYELDQRRQAFDRKVAEDGFRRINALNDAALSGYGTALRDISTGNTPELRALERKHAEETERLRNYGGKKVIYPDPGPRSPAQIRGE